MSFEMAPERVKWWWDTVSSKYMVPDLWKREEKARHQVGFYLGNIQERLA